MSRIKLFGVEIDACTMQEAVSRILDPDSIHARCEFVVTPNLDHAVLLEKNTKLQEAYAHARLVLADGWPVVLASRLLGRALLERVTGSDLVPALFGACQEKARPLTVYLLGAGPGVAERAALKIQERWPAVSVVGTYSPPLGFERDPKECAAIIERINAASPEILVLGLGAPKQELWIDRHSQDLSARWALCVGACIDFLAGEKRRAPRWMQALCLEWLFRLGTEPKRLFKRYLHDGLAFPRLLMKEIFTRVGHKLWQVYAILAQSYEARCRPCAKAWHDHQRSTHRRKSRRGRNGQTLAAHDWADDAVSPTAERPVGPRLVK